MPPRIAYCPARTLWVLVALLVSADSSLVGQVAPPTSAEARAYLDVALDTMEAVIVAADSVEWSALRDSAHWMIEGARGPRDTYGAIAWALSAANRHSFLQVRSPGLHWELLEGQVGYVRVPQRGGPGQTLADSLHTGVAELAAAEVCGWIVDLRGNGGGNMWPMLAGVGPLFGDTILGGFSTGANADKWYYKDGISAILPGDGPLSVASQITVPPLAPVPTDQPVAVLFDGETGSSGEAVAIAFSGRPNSKSFGTRSAGVATVNRGARLPDGANMVVTTGFNADRTGRVQGHFLEPDSAVVGLPAGWPFPTDRVATVAREWVMRSASCAGRSER